MDWNVDLSLVWPFHLRSIQFENSQSKTYGKKSIFQSKIKSFYLPHFLSYSLLLDGLYYPGSKPMMPASKLLIKIDHYSNCARQVATVLLSPSMQEKFHSCWKWSEIAQCIQHQQQMYCCLDFVSLFVCLFHCLFHCLLPLQVFPSPVYPALHLQEYEPTVFAQSAFTSQLWVLVEHSSRSAKIKVSKKLVIKCMNNTYSTGL